jgi:pSer/pThr/pTyr-binding forkhead associated (FHA) protein
LIGRDTDSNLYLDDSGISKNHASIVFSNETYTLRDNGSASGSIVNGTRVRERILAHDDVIQFGPYSFKLDLKNPLPVTTSSVENEVQLKRSGHSYTRRVQIPEIAGLEKIGPLHVVMTDTPKTLPLPLPPTGFLSNVTLQERQNLSLRGTYRYARTGEVLIKEGEDAGRLFLVISGKWEARKDEPPIILGKIQSGDWVGEVNFFDPAGAMCSVVAVEPSEYWEITREAFEKFINDSRSTGSAILIALAATLGRRIRQSTEGFEEAIAARPELSAVKRSWFTPVFAAIGVVAIATAVVFFTAGTADKNRLQAEKQKLVIERAETLQEAQDQVDALRASLNSSLQELEKVRADNESLSKKLIATERTIESINQAKSSLESVVALPVAPAKASPEPVAPAKPSPEPVAPAKASPEPVAPAKASPEDTSRNEILSKAATLQGYPSKITITQKTNVSLMVDGKISGSVVLPEGHELPVVGAEGGFVIVEFGDSHQEIPKENTNFAEALVAEAEAAKNKPAATAPPPSWNSEEPKALVLVPKAETMNTPSDIPKKSDELKLGDVMSVLDGVKLLQTLDDLGRMRSAPVSGLARFLRGLEPKWKRAAKESADLIKAGGGREEYHAILTKVIEASEMLEPARAEMFETKLRDIDAEWIKLKTQEKILNSTDPQAKAGSLL